MEKLIFLWIMFLATVVWGADIQRGKTFTANDTVENTDLHALVDDATITDIDQGDIASNYGLVYRSGSQPSDTDALWYDTGNTTLKVYDGSAYVAVPDADPTFVTMTTTGAATIGGNADFAGTVEIDGNLSLNANVTATTINNVSYNETRVKGWASVNNGGTSDDSFNVTSITDNGTGDYTITWATDFANTGYVTVATPETINVLSYIGTIATGSVQVLSIKRSDGTAIDSTVHVMAIGDQ